MINPQQVEQRCVQVMNMDLVFGNVIANFIGGTNCLARLDPATGHPHCECFHMVVAAHHVARFTLGGAAEFPAPNDNCFVEQAASFEIEN